MYDKMLHTNCFESLSSRQQICILNLFTALCHPLVELDVNSSAVVQAPTIGKKQTIILSHVSIMILYNHSYSNISVTSDSQAIPNKVTVSQH